MNVYLVDILCDDKTASFPVFSVFSSLENAKEYLAKKFNPKDLLSEWEESRQMFCKVWTREYQTKSFAFTLVIVELEVDKDVTI